MCGGGRPTHGGAKVRAAVALLGSKYGNHRDKVNEQPSSKPGTRVKLPIFHHKPLLRDQTVSVSSILVASRSHSSTPAEDNIKYEKPDKSSSNQFDK